MSTTWWKVRGFKFLTGVDSIRFTLAQEFKDWINKDITVSYSEVPVPVLKRLTNQKNPQIFVLMEGDRVLDWMIKLKNGDVVRTSYIQNKEQSFVADAALGLA